MPSADQIPCPDDQRLTMFQAGTLPGVERDSIADHLAICASCQAKVSGTSPTAGDSIFSTPQPGRSSRGSNAWASPDVADANLVASVGSVIAGRYKLGEAIGEGGMGIVYMAEQFEPLRRQVAVKLIKEGMDTRQVLARFEAERQALALMDHPNIARVFDAGATATGRPFFVMELVRGIPITTFCDDHRLPTRERLELFIAACRAIQHAHQKGIIHRDIKPGNVLVARFDGRPVVKVIDFGIAKAVGQALTEKTLVTNLGAVIGTLEYMSPEQARLDEVDVDTRSDVYALGVLLYELLTGSTPLERKRMSKAALIELLRLIREQEPPRPSTRLGSSESLSAIASCRGVEPSRLALLIRGDLDWIAMRALEKDRTRRYETANGLARDVERFLNDEPVEASPPSARYRLGKYARKHRKSLRVAVAAVGLLVAATTISTWEAVRASRAEARERAELVKSEARYHLAREAIETFHTGVSEDVLLREPLMTDLRSKLLSAALQFYQRLQTQRERQGKATSSPEVRAELARGFERLADVTADVGDKEESLAGYRRALPLRLALAAAAPAALGPRRDLADLYHRLGLLYFDIGPPEASADWHRRAADEYRAALPVGGTDDDRLKAASERINVGQALALTVRTDEAVAAFDAAIAELRQLVSARPADFGASRELAQALLKAGILRLNGLPRPLEAIRLIDEANAIHARLAGDRGDDINLRQDWANGLRQAGICREQVGPIEHSLPFYRQALTALEPAARRYPTLSAIRRLTAEIRISIGITLAELPGRDRDALAEYAQASALLEPLVAENPGVPIFRSRLAASESSQGYSLDRLRDYDEAARAFGRSIALRERLTRDQPTVAFFRTILGEDYGHLGDVHRHAGRPAEALKLYRRAITTMGDLQGTNIIAHLNLASWLSGAAAVLDHGPDRSPNIPLDAERRALIDRALTLLREVADSGFHDAPSLRGDENFAPLHDLPAYRVILRDMAFPDQPFAD